VPEGFKSNICSSPFKAIKSTGPGMSGMTAT
jgi:hypothetical protein